MTKERAVYSKASKGDGDMKRKYNERKLTRLILGALLMGGAIFAPGVAMAAEVTWDGSFYIDDSGNPFPFPTVTPEANAIKLVKTDAGNIEGYIENSFVEQGYKTLTLSGAGNAGLDHVAAVLQPFGLVEDSMLNVKGGTWNKVCGAVTVMGSVSKNTVNISGDTILGTVYGGFATGLGGFGHVTENIVNIKGGSGYMTIAGGCSESGRAKGNIVNLSGGDLSGATVSGGMSTTGNAIDNTVNVLASMTLMAINGGTGSGAGDTGNTINIAAKDVTITDNIYAVQNLNFYLPPDIAANDPVPMLTVNGGATYLTGTTIGAAALTGVSLSKGDTVTLLHNANGLTGTPAAMKTITTQPTATSLTVDKSYTFNFAQTANDITATVADVNAGENEQAKSLVETRAATTTFINAGADMLASQGFAQAANAVALDTAEQAQGGAAEGETGTGAPTAGGFTPFAAFGGSSLRAESGSYVNTKGFGLNIGFARELSNAQGRLLFGPMVEYGGGTYTSHLDDGTRGDGKSNYFGVGLMARQVNHDGFYYEGSLRGGRVSSDYRGNLDGLGAVEYDSASPYIAAHLGAGKVFSLGSGNTVDGYLKYFYSRQNGDDTTVHVAGAADEQGSFDAVNSHRIRIGARFTHKVNEKNSFYGGLAYQYEFKGDARAHFSGNAAPSPSVKGSSGMLELGWQVKPGDGPLTLDLGFTGWAGRQRGGSVQLGATWSF